jgi:hypothetical protein
MDGTGAAPNRPDTPTWLPFAAAAALVVLVIAITLFVKSGGTDDGFDLRTSATIPSGHAAAAVVHLGDTVRGSGEVVIPPGGPVRFCAPVAAPADGSPSCPLSIALTGAAVHTLRPGHDATITGVYHGQSISVTDVKTYNDRVGHPIGHDVVPCTPPDGGWPNGDIDLGAAQQYQATHPDDVVIEAILRPSKAAAVAYVVTSGDPTNAGNALTKTYGKRLCVVQSPFSTRQIARAKRLITSHVGATITDANSGGGPTIDSHGNVIIEADVPIVDASFAKAVDAQSADLVQLTVWLRPTS